MQKKVIPPSGRYNFCCIRGLLSRVGIHAWHNLPECRSNGELSAERSAAWRAVWVPHPAVTLERKSTNHSLFALWQPYKYLLRHVRIF